jgi:putative transcriptional regulator
MEKLKTEIAGEITMSSDVGAAMRKWRELFGISQTELAEYLKISTSTISDYESNRRKSPGVQTIKRFVEALIDLDIKKGGEITKKIMEAKKNENNYFEVHEFARAITITEFAELIGAGVLTNKDVCGEKKVYGYTLIDSLRTILEMPYYYFSHLYGRTSERALIFTGVSTGRSPMIAIRVSPIKPSAVVLHGIVDVDKLALKISEKEGIPLLITNIDISTIMQRLNRI